MKMKPKVITDVVENDLCIGCGVCVYKCPSNAISMNWNDEGFIVPQLTGECGEEGACIEVCPFNPVPAQDVRDESVLADYFLPEVAGEYSKIGKLIGTYAGYSKQHRDTSSSGGIATYVFERLLTGGVVDHVISVQASDSSDSHYKYTISSSVEEIRKSSKTRYYPVTLASVLPELKKLNGRVAVSGVACFVKAVRLAQHKDPELRDKIPFVVGIICGGVKSRFFTEYLASKAQASSGRIKQPEYRIKNKNSTAIDYSFGCFDVNEAKPKLLRMSDVGDMWGTGFFKSNACDFCDDVTTELSDISLGDAWIDPYRLDGRGTSIIITRSVVADDLIRAGIGNAELSVERIAPEAVLLSQQGSYNHRHDGLIVRLREAERKNIKIQPKRYGFKKVGLDVVLIQKARMAVRKKSLVLWKITQSAENLDNAMAGDLLRLKVLSRIARYRRMIKVIVRGRGK